jgi:hypothetical protein
MVCSLPAYMDEDKESPAYEKNRAFLNPHGIKRAFLNCEKRTDGRKDRQTGNENRQI